MHQCVGNWEHDLYENKAFENCLVAMLRKFPSSKITLSILKITIQAGEFVSFIYLMTLASY